MSAHLGWAGLNGRMYRAEIFAQDPSVQKYETLTWCKRDQKRFEMHKTGLARKAFMFD